MAQQATNVKKTESSFGYLSTNPVHNANQMHDKMGNGNLVIHHHSSFSRWWVGMIFLIFLIVFVFVGIVHPSTSASSILVVVGSSSAPPRKGSITWQEEEETLDVVIFDERIKNLIRLGDSGRTLGKTKMTKKETMVDVNTKKKIFVCPSALAKRPKEKEVPESEREAGLRTVSNF